MLVPATFRITDDSGFLAIVNADQYNSFVGKEWEFSQLLNHFIEEMNNDHLITWATGLENEWTVDFLNEFTNNRAFREFSKTITVTNGQLFLTNYEDLTMAAQFADEKIPASHNSNLFIELTNGEYELTVRQLFDPADYEYDEANMSFEIIVQKAIIKNPHPVSRVFWMED